MQKEPTIYQLEKLISAFRLNGGSDAEINMVAQDIIREFAPEKTRSHNEVFAGEDHQSIKKIKDFKKDTKNPFIQAISDTWAHSYIKYPAIFIASFLFFFSVLNLPLIVTKLTPTQKKDIKYEVYKEVIQPKNSKSAALDPGEVIPPENRLIVPKLGVTAPIVFVESTNENAIHEGLRSGVVHYHGTANPGEEGNSFITGHSSNYWWEKGGYNYIFANLDKLQIGDQAKIYYNGNKLIYQVKSKVVVEPTDLSVLAQSSLPTLSLMTCTPPGTSWKRLVVQFDQIAPKYDLPTIVEKKRPVISELPKADSNSLLDFIAKIFRF